MCRSGARVASWSSIGPPTITNTVAPIRPASKHASRRSAPRACATASRWVDAPPEYGPRKTLYNRFVRWAEKGVWADVFHALAQAAGPPAQVFSPGIFWSGLSLNRFGSVVQHLQMNS